MPAFLTVDHLSAVTADGTTLFSDLSFVLHREVIGLVGRNGCGKSTLLSILAGIGKAGSGKGDVGSVSRQGRFALLEQIRPDDASVEEALGVADALAVLRRMEAGEGEMDDAAIADWTLEERLAQALSQIGLAGLSMHAPVKDMSGGERMRLGIAALLLGQPDVLLLDEPTNDMDAAGREIVRDLLRGWQGGAIVASHDRDLLEDMDRIVHLSSAGCMIYGGGWSDFIVARDAAREQAGVDLVRAQRRAKQVVLSTQEQAERQARRDKAGRRKRAKGDAPKILMDAQADRAERTAGRGNNHAAQRKEQAQHMLDDARRQIEVVAPLHIDLPSSGLSAGRIVLRLEDVMCDRPNRDGVRASPLFGPLSFTIAGPQRVAIHGSNGSGKTSLLRIIMGQQQPASGMIFRGEGDLAMLDQHVSLINPGLSLLDNMLARHPGMTASSAHEVLARFAFRNRDALRPASTLSGGEKLRAGLALVTGGPVAPRLLLLDEPTNHLDIEASELLELALIGWDGALVIVSHDRAFLDAIGIDHEIYLPG